MVYCRLLSKTKNIIKYAIGSLYDDITGIMELNPGELSYQIIKEPRQEGLYSHFIDKMLMKYKDKLASGIIPEKMSYEI